MYYEYEKQLIDNHNYFIDLSYFDISHLLKCLKGTIKVKNSVIIFIFFKQFYSSSQTQTALVSARLVNFSNYLLYINCIVAR